jgi:tRNA threonylcarbamoyladenosine modification (KEOPS) complex  Pcc1 subunit
MTVTCSLSLEFTSGEEARRVLESVRLDDEGFVRSEVKGNRLEATISAASVPSLLHTLDDYLACVSVADGVLKKKMGKV